MKSYEIRYVWVSVMPVCYRLCVLFLLFAPGLMARDPDSSSALFAMREAEHQFASLSAAKGRQVAFAEFIADDGVIFRDNVVRNAKQYWKTQEPTPWILKWEPEYQDVAASGDFGYSLGPWEMQEYRPYTKPVAYGYFLSVWKKQADGAWRVILDTGTGGSVKRDSSEVKYGFPPDADKPRVYRPVNDMNALRSELVKLDQEASEALRDGLVDGFRAHLADQAIVMRKGKLPTGHIDSIIVSLRLTGDTDYWQTGDMRAAVSGDMAYTYGSYRLALSESESRRMHYVRIWKRQSDVIWKIVVDLM